MNSTTLKLTIAIAAWLAGSIIGAACGDQEADTAPSPASDAAPATVVSAPVEAPAAAQDPAGPASDATIEPLLSGDTLARYQALPPAFRTALDVYAWYGVEPDLIPLAAADKMDQWDDNAIPLGELIGEERAGRFRGEIFGAVSRMERHANVLLSGYVYLLENEPSAERRIELMRELVNDPLDYLVELTDDSANAAPASPQWVPLPDASAILTPTALSRLDALGPRLREMLFAPRFMPNEGRMPRRELAEWLTQREIFLLKAEPGLEAPAIESHLSGESLAAFNALSDAWREYAEDTFGQQVTFGYIYNALWEGHFGWGDASRPFPVGDKEFAALAEEFVEHTAGSEAIGLQLGISAPPNAPAVRGADGLPPYIAILSQPYQDAYRLLPDGEWAFRYIDQQFDDFNVIAFATADDTAPTMPDDYAPELGAGDEWILTRALRDEEHREWLENRVGEIAPDVAQSFADAQEVEARLDILRSLYEAEGKDVDILVLAEEWRMRGEGLRGDDLAAASGIFRFSIEKMDAVARMSPRQQTIAIHEERVCVALSQLVIGGDPFAYILGGGCDIAATVDAAERALQASGGEYPISEEEFETSVKAGEELRANSPAAAQDPAGPAPANATIEPLLSGDTLARYRALPPAFRTALDVYAWYGVEPDLIPLAARDKMNQWGEAAIPLGELIGEERAGRFRGDIFGAVSRMDRHANVLLSGYVYLLENEPSAERRIELMRELVNDPLDYLVELTEDAKDAATTSPTLVPLPDARAILTPTALSRLDVLGPRLRSGLLDAEAMGNEGRMPTRELAEWLTQREMFLLKAEPGLEAPAIESRLSGESLAAFNALSDAWREYAAEMFGQHVTFGYIYNALWEGHFEWGGAGLPFPVGDKNFAALAEEIVEATAQSAKIGREEYGLSGPPNAQSP